MAPPSPSVDKQLFDLALPVIGLNLLSVMSMIVDTAMCGQLAHPEAALTGLSYATQLVWFVLVAMFGLSIGSVAMVSRAHGSGDGERVTHILLQSTQLTVLLGSLVAVIGASLAHPTLVLLGAEGDALAAAEAYLVPILLGSVFSYLNILYAAVLRAAGNTRLSFWVAVGVNSLNVVLNYGLILGNFGLPSMGVGGAALGTVISQACGLFLTLGLLYQGAVPKLRLPRKPALPNFDTLGELLRIGAPAGLDLVVLNAGFLSIIGMLGSLNQFAVAAHGIGLRIQALAFVPGLSVSQATSALVGKALGSDDRKRAREISRAAIRLAVTIMVTLAIPLIVFAPQIVVIFGVGPQSPVFPLAIDWIRILGFGMPLVGVHIALTGVLRGAGATSTSLSINMVTTLAQVPLSALLGFSFGWGPFGIWLAFPVAFLIKAGLGVAAYRQGNWAKTGKRLHGSEDATSEDATAGDAASGDAAAK